jgi:hypothetical protein
LTFDPLGEFVSFHATNRVNIANKARFGVCPATFKTNPLKTKLLNSVGHQLDPRFNALDYAAGQLNSLIALSDFIDHQKFGSGTNVCPELSSEGRRVSIVKFLFVGCV